MSIKSQDLVKLAPRVLEMHFNGIIDLAKVSEKYNIDEIVTSLMMVGFCYKEMPGNLIGKERLFPFLKAEIDREKDFQVARLAIDKFIFLTSS
ncbi:hypothetical protein ACXGSL_10885 [Vreelandella aquamarina]